MSSDENVNPEYLVRFNFTIPLDLNLSFRKGIESLKQTLIFQIPVALQPNVVDLRYCKL